MTLFKNGSSLIHITSTLLFYWLFVALTLTVFFPVPYLLIVVIIILSFIASRSKAQIPVASVMNGHLRVTRKRGAVPRRWVQRPMHRVGALQSFPHETITACLYLQRAFYFPLLAALSANYYREAWRPTLWAGFRARGDIRLRQNIGNCRACCPRPVSTELLIAPRDVLPAFSLRIVIVSSLSGLFESNRVRIFSPAANRPVVHVDRRPHSCFKSSHSLYPQSTNRGSYFTTVVFQVCMFFLC